MGRIEIKTLHFLAKNLLSLLMSLLLLMVLCFLMIRFFPGNPYSLQEGLTDPEVIEKLNSIYPVDVSFLTQLQFFFKEILSGNLGQSLHHSGRSVNSLLWENGKISFLLGGSAFLLAILFSVLYAFWTRLWNIQALDYLLLLIYSIPLLVLAPVAIWFLAIKNNFFPMALLETPLSFVLPISLLTLKPSLSLTRILTESLDQNLQTNYVSFAKASGFSNSQILIRWCFKNSMIPYFVHLASVFIGLLSGSFLVEVLFAIPGLGQQFIESVINRDWPLVTGLTFVYGLLVLGAHFLAEVLSRFVDPKLRGS
jgi:ABC-type dipeptide/oligopeptide/nickel transport system permease component